MTYLKYYISAGLISAAVFLITPTALFSFLAWLASIATFIVSYCMRTVFLMSLSDLKEVAIQKPLYNKYVFARQNEECMDSFIDFNVCYWLFILSTMASAFGFVGNIACFYGAVTTIIMFFELIGTILSTYENSTNQS